MSERRWKPGMSVRTGDGLSWRVSPGAKSPNDLVLEVQTARGWRNVKMQSGFLMADFLGENENVLRDDGYFPATASGGDYYLRHLAIAVRDGWQVADGKLERERGSRRAREGASAPRLVIGGKHVCEWERRQDVFVCIHCGETWQQPQAAGNELF